MNFLCGERAVRDVERRSSNGNSIVHGEAGSEHEDWARLTAAEGAGEWTKIEIKELCPLERRTGCTASCAQHSCWRAGITVDAEAHYTCYPCERIVYGDSCLAWRKKGSRGYITIVFVSSYSLKHEWSRDSTLDVRHFLAS